MKPIFALGVTLFLAGAAGAQVRIPPAAPAYRPTVVPSAVRPGAPIVAPPSTRPLGAFLSNATSRPLGGVALPTFPPSFATPRRGGHHMATPRYVGPVYYVPNAFDSVYDYSAAAAEDAAATASPAPQRVIVNQYFLSPPPAAAPREDNRLAPSAEQPLNPGDPIGTPENYYLIVYKNHTIYPALAYWVEGDTLHYVTTQNTHNQASIALLDIEQTTKLNADRAIPFALPGR